LSFSFAKLASESPAALQASGYPISPEPESRTSGEPRVAAGRSGAVAGIGRINRELGPVHTTPSARVNSESRLPCHYAEISMPRLIHIKAPEE
jgi:hypothetical protein